MPEVDLGADRITVGTSDITMRIWLELEQAGEPGLSRGELQDLVGDHVNAGFARRRYLKQRLRQRQEISSRAQTRPREDISWETTDVTRARDYVVTTTLGNMKRVGSVILAEDGRYHAGRKPRFQRDESIIDLRGDRTRIHMNSAHALRILEPAAARIRQSSRAQLTRREKEAFLKLVELHKEMLRRGLNGELTRSGD